MNASTSMITVNKAPSSEQTASGEFDRRMAAVMRAVEDHHAYLQDYLFRLTRNWHDAENLLQDLWIYALHHLDENKISSLPLLRLKAHHLFIDHYRRLTRRGEVVSDTLPEVPEAQDKAHSFSDAGEAAMQERFWENYPDIDLTDLQKQALWLHARYGFTVKEIEGMIAVPSSTIGDWLVLARKRIAEHIDSH